MKTIKVLWDKLSSNVFTGIIIMILFNTIFGGTIYLIFFKANPFDSLHSYWLTIFLSFFGLLVLGFGAFIVFIVYQIGKHIIMSIFGIKDKEQIENEKKRKEESEKKAIFNSQSQTMRTVNSDIKKEYHKILIDYLELLKLSNDIAVQDSKNLKYGKSKIKEALLFVLQHHIKNDEDKNVYIDIYISLSRFQNGIGDKPILKSECKLYKSDDKIIIGNHKILKTIFIESTQLKKELKQCGIEKKYSKIYYNSEMTIDEADRIVNDFAELIGSRTYFVQDEKDLPYPKELIKKAFYMLLVSEMNMNYRELLAMNYCSLSFFQPNIGKPRNINFGIYQKDNSVDMDELIDDIEVTKIVLEEYRLLYEELIEKGF